MNSKKIKDKLMKNIVLGVSSINIIIVILIFLFIFTNSMKFFQMFSIKDFFLGREWIPLSGKYGVLPLLSGSFWVTLTAVLISVPLALVASVYISEYASPKVRDYMKILIETMSAIPSVVLGYLGLYFLSIAVKNTWALDTGLTAFTGGILLAFMALPTMISVAEDSLRALDSSYKEASLALGANKLETIVKVLIPGAFPGIFAGFMLGFGRIIGETMAVLMVTGNAPIIQSTVLAPVRTLTATIAAEMGEVVQGSMHYYSLFAIGLILFIVSFTLNTIADHFIQKSRKLKNN